MMLQFFHCAVGPSVVAARSVCKTERAVFYATLS